MGIFTRFRDIIGSNINAMLDKAEDPEKMVRLMIREMEETLVEIKASCAGTMADRKKVGRELEDVQKHVDTWKDRAVLAVDKGREDLAKEALVEKRRWEERSEQLQAEAGYLDELVKQSQDDIMQLEEKLKTAQERQRVLVQRHIRATSKKKAQQDIRKAESNDAILRFEQFEQRIERMEAEAEIINPTRKPSLVDEFALLEGEDEIQEELEALKKERGAGK